MNTLYVVTHAELDGPLGIRGYAWTSKPSLTSKRRCLPSAEMVQDCTGCKRPGILEDDGSISPVPGVLEVGRFGQDLGFTVVAPNGEVCNPYLAACLAECKRCNGSGAREEVREVLRNAYLARAREVGRRL